MPVFPKGSRREKLRRGFLLRAAPVPAPRGGLPPTTKPTAALALQPHSWAQVLE